MVIATVIFDDLTLKKIEIGKNTRPVRNFEHQHSARLTTIVYKNAFWLKNPNLLLWVPFTAK